MCWNIESSVISAIYGYAVSVYLFHRRYSGRDRWYAVFLATFTTTQVIDGFFWYIAGDGDEIPCTDINWYVSKFLIPPVVFFQPIVLASYPSCQLSWLRWPYRILTVGGMMVPVILCGCTTLLQTTGGYYDGLSVILYGGVIPPLLVMLAGVGFWSLGVVLFVTPWWVGTHILAIGGLNLVLLQVLDGTIQLVSKLCFYCLLLSIMWALEPLYESALTRNKTSQQQLQIQQDIQQQEQIVQSQHQILLQTADADDTDMLKGKILHPNGYFIVPLKEIV